MAYKRILLVEDDADIRLQVVLALELEGYEVVQASNGKEALALLRSSSPEGLPCCIILDLMMPVMDGWEFRRRQREDPALASVPVVVLSALDQTRFVVYGTPKPGTTLQQLEDGIEAVIADLMKDGVTAEELERWRTWFAPRVEAACSREDPQPKFWPTTSTEAPW